MTKEIKAIRKFSVTEGQICATININDAKELQKQLSEAIKNTKEGGSHGICIRDTDNWRILSIGIIK
jgi:hypothetical protein